jgi:hypothetical protein
MMMHFERLLSNLDRRLGGGGLKNLRSWYSEFCTYRNCCCGSSCTTTVLRSLACLYLPVDPEGASVFTWTTGHFRQPPWIG